MEKITAMMPVISRRLETLPSSPELFIMQPIIEIRNCEDITERYEAWLSWVKPERLVEPETVRKLPTSAIHPWCEGWRWSEV